MTKFVTFMNATTPSVAIINIDPELVASSWHAGAGLTALNCCGIVHTVHGDAADVAELISKANDYQVGLMTSDHEIGDADVDPEKIADAIEGAKINAAIDQGHDQADDAAKLRARMDDNEGDTDRAAKFKREAKAEPEAA